MSFAECTRSGHSAKFFFNFFSTHSFPKKRFYFFAACPRSGHFAKFFFHFLSSPSFPEKKILFLCRVQKRKHSANPLFAECFFLPSVFSAALGKELICRVPEIIHSANLTFPVVSAKILLLAIEETEGDKFSNIKLTKPIKSTYQNICKKHIVERQETTPT